MLVNEDAATVRFGKSCLAIYYFFVVVFVGFVSMKWKADRQ
jgi:hypothetical protein